MKKQYLLMAAFASALAFTACTNDDEPIIGPNGDNPEIIEDGTTFEIAISNTGEGTTKAVRPMGSSAAANNVDKVKLVVYKYDTSSSSWKTVNLAAGTENIPEGQLCLEVLSGSDGATTGVISTGVINYPNANTPESEMDPTIQHISKRAVVKAHGLEKDAQYQIVAYGYNGDNFPGTATAAGTGFANGVFKAGMSAISNPYSDIQEVFADSEVANTTTVPGDADGNGTVEDNETVTVFTVAPTLTLTRQVAGILAYFENVPVQIANQSADGKSTQVAKIKVVANHKASDFYFPAMLLDDEDFNGIIAEADANATEDLIVFDLSKIATNYADAVTDGDDFYTFNGTDAQTPNALPYAENYTAPTGLQLAENTIFGARYILPYDKDYDTPTLTLQFLDGSDNILLSRDITTDNIPSGNTAYNYDIRCNNFYSIGQKLEAGSTEGPDDDDDDDDDDPMDLTSDQITVRVNDAWAVLHNMGIE